MKLIPALIFMIFLTSCSSGVYNIKMIGAELITMKRSELNPDYKGVDTYNDEIKIGIFSKIDFFNESKMRGMTLYSYTGDCDRLEHIPLLATVNVFYNGKALTHLPYEESIMPNYQGGYLYNIYLNFEKLKSMNKEERMNLCTIFGGDSYFFGYKSNVIKLDLSDISFDG